MEGGKGVGGRGGRDGGVGQWPGRTIVVIWAFGDVPSASPVLADNHISIILVTITILIVIVI